MLCAEPDIPPETADGRNLAVKRWTVNRRGWGRLAFLSAEPALAGNLWHWEGSVGNHCSQGLPGRALSNSSGPSCKVKVVMLTHAEVVRSGKLWRSCVATHFKMLWGSQNVFLASKPEHSYCRALESEQASHRSQLSVQACTCFAHTMGLSRTAPLSAVELVPMVVWDYQWNSLSEEIL